MQYYKDLTFLPEQNDGTLHSHSVIIRPHDIDNLIAASVIAHHVSTLQSYQTAIDQFISFNFKPKKPFPKPSKGRISFDKHLLRTSAAFKGKKPPAYLFESILDPETEKSCFIMLFEDNSFLLIRDHPDHKNLYEIFPIVLQLKYFYIHQGKPVSLTAKQDKSIEPQSDLLLYINNQPSLFNPTTDASPCSLIDIIKHNICLWAREFDALPHISTAKETIPAHLVSNTKEQNFINQHPVTTVPFGQKSNISDQEFSVLKAFYLEAWIYFTKYLHPDLFGKLEILISASSYNQTGISAPVIAVSCYAADDSYNDLITPDLLEELNTLLLYSPLAPMDYRDVVSFEESDFFIDHTFLFDAFNKPIENSYSSHQLLNIIDRFTKNPPKLPRHRDFNFTPKIIDQKHPTNRLLTRCDRTKNRPLASFALEAIFSKQTDECAKTDRLYLSEKEALLLQLTISTNAPQRLSVYRSIYNSYQTRETGKKYGFLLFEDMSCLILRASEEEGKILNIFPVALRLGIGSGILPADVSFTFVTQTDNPRVFCHLDQNDPLLGVAFLEAQTLHQSNTNTPPLLIDICRTLKRKLYEEIDAWASESQFAPLLRMPNQTAVASPETDNKSYAWSEDIFFSKS